MTSVVAFQQRKQNGERISLTTCYDYWSACIIRETPVDAVLVGDSASMVMHGFPSTIHASVEMMVWHVAAVSRALTERFIIADLPFLAHRKGLTYLMESVDKLMKAGSHAIKIEGGSEVVSEIHHIVQSGVPVMGHLGLTPQSVNLLGGHKLQATRPEAAEKLLRMPSNCSKQAFLPWFWKWCRQTLRVRLPATSAYRLLVSGQGLIPMVRCWCCRIYWGCRKIFLQNFCVST